MNIFFGRNNESKRKIVKIIEDKELKENKCIIESKFKSNIIKRAKMVRRCIKENNKKFSDKIRVLGNKNNILLKKNLNKNNFVNLIILFLKFIFILSEFNQENLFFKFSEVTLKLKGTGNTKMLSDDFFKIYNPNEILLNDSILNVTTNNIHLNNSEITTIKIIWNNEIKSLDNMFKDCDSIIEIDLSNFNTSQITNMSYMFYNCPSLVSIYLSNLDTSKVVDMSYIF